MTDQPARYRRTPADIEAVQWTGTNTDALRAFAGSDFDTIDPEDRIADPDQDAQLLVEASHWVGIGPGDWVVKCQGYFVAKADATFRAVWEPAAVPVPPPADQTALRDRIAEALCERERPPRDPAWAEAFAMDREVFEAMADAVLAVLPEQTDRAAVLREAAAIIEAEQAREEATEWAQYGSLDHETELGGGYVRASAALLRRVAAEEQPAKPDRCPHGCDTSICPCLACEAAEEQPAETEPQPESCAHCGKTIQRITGTLAQWWVHNPGGHTTCFPKQAASSPRATPQAATEQPAVGEQPETQETP